MVSAGYCDSPSLYACIEYELPLGFMVMVTWKSKCPLCGHSDNFIAFVTSSALTYSLVQRKGHLLEDLKLS